MSNYTITNKSLNKNKVFILQKSELEKRFDPYFYLPKFKNLEDKLSSKNLKTLSEISTNIFSGSTPKSKGDAYTTKENGVAFVRSGDFNIDGTINFNKLVYLKNEVHEKQLKSSKLKNNDLLFAIVGATIGKVGVYKNNREANINQAICAVRLKEEFNIDYLNAYFQTSVGQSLIDRIKRPVARANVNLDEIASLPVVLPSPVIQNKVIEIFNDSLLKKKENEIKAKKLLESIDEYILNALNISLPERKNSLKDRIYTINYESLQDRLDPFFYNVEFQEIESNILNSKWNTYLLKDIFSINRGGSPRPIHNFYTEDENGVNWIKIGDTKKTVKYITKTKQKIIPEGVKYSREVFPGDFILSNSMSFGKPYIMKISGCIHDGWLLLSPKTKIANNDYLHNILSSKLIYRLFKKSTIGGVVDNLNIELVKKIRIPVPPLEKQNEISAHISAIRKQSQDLKDQTKLLLEKANKEIENLILYSQ